MKKCLIFLLSITAIYAYVLKPGTQMRPNESFEITYDIDFRLPVIDSLDASKTQDTTIVKCFTRDTIYVVIQDVNPSDRNILDSPTYRIGNEVITSTNCHIEYEYISDPSIFGSAEVPLYSNDYDYIDIKLNSKIDKVRKWGIIDDPDAYRNPRNTLTHELLHSLTLRHSLVSEIMLNGTNFNKVVPVKVGYNDVNGLIAIYNGPKIIEPDTLKTSSKDSIIVIKGQKINFKVLPNNDTTPAYPYTASIYNVKPNNTYTSYGKMTLINGDSIKYSWDTTEMERDTMNIEFYMKGAEYIGKSIFQDIAGNQVVYLSCNQRPSKRRFSVCDYLVYEPKADTAIVAKAGNFIPVSLRISDLNSAISKLDGVYNIDSLRVQYVLWNDGFAWLNDSISTSPSIDPRKEFKWYFAQFDSDTTINMNHPDLEVNADYFIKAHLYQKDGENLTYIGTAESGNFDIMPEVMIWIDPTVSENEVFRSTDTTHLITAVCLEPDGTNYGFWGMDYYYKFDDESVWTKFGDHKKEKEEIQVDTCTWNCGTKKGYGWLKAVADLTHEISFHYGIV